VHMTGGKIKIQLDDDFVATMTGPVTKVCDGNISDEMFEKILITNPAY
jgi:diaminopimelate epimerase